MPDSFLPFQVHQRTNIFSHLHSLMVSFEINLFHGYSFDQASTYLFITGRTYCWAWGGWCLVAKSCHPLCLISNYALLSRVESDGFILCPAIFPRCVFTGGSWRPTANFVSSFQVEANSRILTVAICLWCNNSRKKIPSNGVHYVLEMKNLCIKLNIEIWFMSAEWPHLYTCFEIPFEPFSCFDVWWSTGGLSDSIALSKWRIILWVLDFSLVTVFYT